MTSLDRARAWDRAATYAEQAADAAMRRGDATEEARHLAEMHRALRLREQNIARHEAATASK